MGANVTNPELRARLIAIAKADQDMRIDAIHNKGEWNHDLDRKHSRALKEIIAEYGWPTVSVVGVEASNDAWLIAQHADHDVPFQKTCLALLKKVPSGEVPLSNIAYLEDRILVAEHKPQLYGTQFQGAGPDMKPQPIRDKTHVDARRKEMGLGTLEEYTKLMFETCKNTD